MKILSVLFLLFLPWAAQAETYVQINGVSMHDQSGYNSFNYGAGVEHTFDKDWSVAGGWYRNSEYRGSSYAYGRYSFYKQHDWDLGIGVGAVTGYRRATVLPMAFPEVCYSWLCAVAFPKVEATGANVVGLRLRIPVN
jgi:hypothetical protein